jgi:sirohydrochlorin ferrochelatase
MNRRFSSILFTALAVALSAGGAHAQTAKVGTILVAHGAGEGWNSKVEAVAKLARTGGPVEVAYLMGDGAKLHRFQDAASRLVKEGATEIVVVPLLVSSFSGHYDQIRYLSGQTDSIGAMMMHHLQMSGLERPSVKVPVRLAPALDDSPQVAAVLADRVREMAASPEEQAVFIIGHGPNSAEDFAAWMKNLRPIADSVKARTGVRDVKIGLVRDDAPPEVRAEAVREIREVILLQNALTGKPVVVVPILISTGSVSNQKLPADLEGLPVVYRGEPLLPHPAIARWVESRVKDSHLTAARTPQPAAHEGMAPMGHDH